MSRDADPQQRLWLSLGYGGKTAPSGTWRYWQKRGEDRTWIIAAPNDLAEFEQRDKEVYLNDQKLFTESTQWRATWRALAYFYEHAVSTVTPPPKS